MKLIYTCIRCNAPVVKTVAGWGKPATLYHQATLSEACIHALAAIDESATPIEEFEVFDRVVSDSRPGVGTITDIRAGAVHPLTVIWDDGSIGDHMPSQLTLR